MEILFEHVNFYGENWRTTAKFPDDIVFVEVDRYKVEEGVDHQRFYAAFYPYSKEVWNMLSKQSVRFSTYNFLDKWILIEIWNAYPVNEDLPLISMDEFNEKWLPVFNKYIYEKVGSKRILEDAVFEIRKALKENRLPDLSELENMKDPYFTVCMYKILKFKGHNDHLLAECAYVAFTSWASEDKEIKEIGVFDENFKRFFNDDVAHNDKFIISDSQEAWDKFRKRKEEILMYCGFNDNSGSILKHAEIH